MRRTETHDFYERQGNCLFSAIWATAPEMLLRNAELDSLAILARDLSPLLGALWTDWPWAADDAGTWEMLNTSEGRLLALVSRSNPLDP